MNLSDYTYNLPDELIADHPPEARGESRLLVLSRETGEIKDDLYKNVADFLHEGDVLVLNDTKVLKARLKAIKQNGVERELVLLEKHGSQDDWHRHKVLYRRSLAAGDILTIADDAVLHVEEVLGDGIAVVKSDVDLLEIAAKYGTVPLPPYMNRDATPMDIERYQTVWAQEVGSVAAPTASLNMTDEILDSLRRKGVTIAYLTLHVGLGTFLPIRVDDLSEHQMHKEYFEIPAGTIAALQKARRQGGRIIALGTTVARTLEYAADAMVAVPKDVHGEADIFIYPGYTFRTIDGLLTNYHAPKSTVLMLTAAFAGWDHLLPAYEHAVKEEYAFFSYGDSMLII